MKKPTKELMAARTDADCEELFEASRTYSDEAFCMSREGKISEDEEFAYRVQKTYADVGVEVSKRRGKTIRRTIPLLPKKAYSGTRNYKTDP